MSEELFILGAGFNLDANKYLDPKNQYLLPSANEYYNPPLQWETEPLSCSYPKVNDLVHACFGLRVDPKTSAEKLFTQAYKKADWIPIERLVDIIQAADHYIASKIINYPSTPYLKFFQYFNGSHFLSYNYDCFAELHLQKLHRWHPLYGFGMQVQYSHSQSVIDQDVSLQNVGSSIVLHLHGSFYLYPIETDISPADINGTRWLTPRPSPRFIFDPDTLCDAFSGFTRPELDHGYSPPVARLIPPIADKSSSLVAKYYNLLIERAVNLINEASCLISIGYSFAENDSESYDILLKRLFEKGKKLLIVNPSSDQIVYKIKSRYRSYSPSVYSLPLTFSQWAEKGFPRGTL